MHDSATSTILDNSASPPIAHRKRRTPTRRRKDHVHDFLTGSSRDNSVERMDTHLRHAFVVHQKGSQLLTDPLKVNNEDPSEPEEGHTYSPATPWGVINFAIDTAETLSYSGFLVLILVLPPVLYFTFLHRLLALVASYTTAIWNFLLAYPTDPAIRRAHTVRNVARTVVMLRVWIHIMSQYDYGNCPWAAGVQDWRGLSLVGVVVIALLPINALAAVVDALTHVCSRIADHLRSNAAYYTLTICVVGSSAVVYCLLAHIFGEAFAEDARRKLQDPLRLHRQILAELAELRAEVKALRQS